MDYWRFFLRLSLLIPSVDTSSFLVHRTLSHPSLLLFSLRCPGLLPEWTTKLIKPHPPAVGFMGCQCIFQRRIDSWIARWWTQWTWRMFRVREAIRKEKKICEKFFKEMKKYAKCVNRVEWLWWHFIFRHPELYFVRLFASYLCNVLYGFEYNNLYLFLFILFFIFIIGSPSIRNLRDSHKLFLHIRIIIKNY